MISVKASHIFLFFLKIYKISVIFLVVP